jgi:diaminohydroxyphosphoribosylaminopyrimidine deaminase/5-amino-6-(5-phosphoribosylamino)uracil reductase
VDTGLPLVTYKAAVSVDGKLAAADGGARWISSVESRRLVHALRARADAVLVGAGTVRRDDPSLTVRDAAGRDPVRVVLARHGDVPLDATLVATARETPTLLVAETIDGDREAALRERGVEVVVTGAAGPRAALAALAQRGLLDVLCEGGPTLAAALLREGLVERLLLFVAPLLVGAGAPELLALPAAATMDDVLRLDEVSWERVGDDVLLRARMPRRAAAASTGASAADVRARVATQGGDA